jgi:hypothetical protein
MEQLLVQGDQDQEGLKEVIIIEAPFFDPDDGQGDPGNSDEEEDLTGDPDADGGSADGNPNPPK